ncbi:MAG: metallophosphoesterase [Acidimicrobiia bacterium]
MLFVSDVHGAMEPLRRLVDSNEQIVILGDLANLTDYRNGEGAVADVLGLEFARASADARASGDYAGMRALWMERVGENVEEVRAEIGRAIERQYDEVAVALVGGHGLVIHGNVDRPRRLRESLPDGFRYVHGEVVDMDGLRFGFVGGGVETPLKVEGEVSDEEMTSLLDGLGAVDVLCTHVPPAVPSVRRDVITGKEERGSGPIRDYLLEHQPRFHLFGDVHQPQATTWRLGATRCFNAGYFRATGRFLRLETTMVHVGRIR